MVKSYYGWGVLLDHWHDERVAHLLRADNSPACGVKYYTATRRDTHRLAKCKRCKRIAENLHKDGVSVAGA